MARKTIPILFTIFCILLSGCAVKANKARLPVLVHTAYTTNQYDQDLTAYQGATGENRVALRNRIAYQIMGEIEEFYRQYEGDVFGRRTALAIGGDFVKLGLAASATLGQGSRTKTILSALLTGATGLDLSVNKNLYEQQTAQAVLHGMRAARNRVKASIIGHLTDDDDEYPWARARMDLIQLLAAGSFKAGLQEVLEKTATEAKVQQDAVLEASSLQVSKARKFNQSVSAALGPSGDPAKVVAFLKAMGVAVDASTPKDKLEQEIRALGRKILTDAALRKKWEEEIQKAGLVP